MSVQNIPFKPSDKERSAWGSLVGNQPLPATRVEMVDTAREVWERRIAQNRSDIVALGDLTSAAETLGVFGGPIDTQNHPDLFKRPASLPPEFRRVEVERLSDRRFAGREAAGDDD